MKWINLLIFQNTLRCWAQCSRKLSIVAFFALNQFGAESIAQIDPLPPAPPTLVPPTPAPLPHSPLPSAPLTRGTLTSGTLTHHIGATLMVGWPGTRVADPSTRLLCQHLSRGQVGGVLFLRHNFQTVDQVQELTTYFSRCGARFAPLLALDQEGGLVDRLGALPGEQNWPSAQEVGAHPLGHAAGFYRQMADRQQDLGFTVNFGPVADLNINPANPIIGRLGRSYGTEAEAITPVLTAFIDAHRDADVATALKHFPGHGSSRTDSHLGFVDISATWTAQELAPFVQMMDAAGAIMAGHLINRQLDEQGRPATLSPPMLTKVLRGQLGFAGPIISDDMVMKAITDLYGFDQSVVMALSAGIDLFVHSNSGPYDPGLVDQYHATVQAAIRDGHLRADTLTASATRIANWKP